MAEQTTDVSDDEIVEGEIVEGEIVDGTWINPSVAANDPRRLPRDRQFSYELPEGRPSFVRMIFGSVVIFTEEISDRASVYDEDDAPRQLVDAAIHQAAQQQEALDRKPFADLRYATIGFLGGALDGAQNGAGRVSNLADTAARTAGKIIGPVWNSFLFAPLHAPAKRAEQAGETRVGEWIRRGRIEEVRSRALAEVSLTNLVEESVTEITENTQVQMIIQEVIASQSTSMVTEILEEIRERLVSLDLVLMGKLGRPLALAPDFRDSYLRSLAERRPRYQHRGMARSLAGTYAGPLTRLAAFLLDVVFLLIVAGLTSAFVSSTLNLFGLTASVNEYLRSGSIVATIALLVVALFNSLLISLYFLVSWNWTGSTLGNAILGLRVVNKNGTRVSFFRSILRLIGMVVSAAVLMIGFIWALFDGRRQGWHDKFGGTFVLYDWPAKPEETFLREQVMVELEEDSRN